MEIKKATINRSEASTNLLLHVGEEPLKIVLTDDNPNNVKAVFNSLLKELKNGLFEFKLEDDTQDLYNFICIEYLIQLNSEMKAVHSELKDAKLITTES